MTDDAKLIGYELLKKGALVCFRIIEEQILAAPADDSEFGMRVELRFTADEGAHDLEYEEAAENTVEWGAFGFIFALAVLSFADARPRNASAIEYQESDEFSLGDLIEHLRFVRGELRFDADYIRGRRLKTRIIVRSNGHVTLETIGRGKAPLRWLDRIQGKTPLQLVGR